MKIKLNGEVYETSAANLKQLLQELRIVTNSVAIELNLTIIRKADHENTAIKENDTVEIIQFVGGG
ncbi:MAG: sulfur carrier protein ThiS [Dissulfurispiraceae bacterium]|jgi:sulfur carrier protein|nr:sulfur carrier protein ThiS [Dissulfurispiraceae bacterium]